jgi:peroxiredoxin
MRRFLKELGLLVLLGAVAAGGVYLVRMNRTLAAENARLARRAVEPRPGLYVGALALTTLDGRPAALGALGHRELLFFFNTTCPYCRASLPAWNAIADRVRAATDLAVYGVAFDSAAAAAAYAAEQGLRFPVIAQPDPRIVGLYRVSSVPLVLVVNADGRMAYVRLGVLAAPRAIDSVVAAAVGTQVAEQTRP